jgi:hypothetical protein
MKHELSHPCEHIQPKRRPGIFLILLAGTILIMLVMNLVGAPLNTQAAPYGIVSFEFSRTEEQAQAILASWGSDGQIRAAFIQGLDFLFPLVYAGAISLGCIMAGEVLQARKWPLARVSGLLAWGMWLAAALDYIENIGLTSMLLGAEGSIWAPLAALCALIKFGLIFLGLAYTLYGLVVRLVVPKNRA